MGTPAQALAADPFDRADAAAYGRWRAAKLERYPRRVADLVVEIADPFALTGAERSAIIDRCARANMALYRTACRDADPALPRALAAQLGLARLDANWLAGAEGISRIEVAPAAAGAAPRGDYIPYTDRAIGWHTDGYYHPASRRIAGMILHCVRPAAGGGGVNALYDPELAYIALRDADPAFVAALAAPDAMTIPARTDANGVARPAQTGPVFSVDPVSGALHMRYTARTRSIVWRDDAVTRAAVAHLERVLASAPQILRLRMAPGMGLVANNVLHDRSAFRDDPAAPRLVLRARFLDRVHACRSD